ncbi:MAG: circadian clock protein KaiC [Thermoleophilaceae bacterium]|jgi:circadian clock protein KaiC|nr:circadian clock protein KaiC [Thermoleophilaceae bacterium]
MLEQRLQIEAEAANSPHLLPKAPTGIKGLDDVTGGGLPRGRPTLVCGPAGCGKTLLGIEFLVRGITDYGEPGVFLAFEETREDLIANVASLGFDLAQLEADGKLAIEHISLYPNEFEQSGEWDLEGLFVWLGAAIDAVKADRVVIDTIENLFAAFSDKSTLRAELRRLFRWLKDRGVTAVITCERGDGSLTPHGIEEYVSDCVIVLDHRVSEETSTRRLRVLKYRGSLHGTNEYPFLIGKNGVSVVPITALGLEHDASGERLSMGVDRLDEMLGGRGVLRGSSILVSGTAGTGKSTVAAELCNAACGRGERALYFAFEESEAQIVRNMSSVGMDLRQWVEQGLLQFRCVRPSLLGLEAHLSSMQDLVMEYEPAVVVVDPISDLLTAGASRDVSAMLTRQVDFLKVKGATALFTSLDQDLQLEQANHQIAALIDVWLLMTTEVSNGERNRSLSVLKARGMAHSNQIREFLLTERGIELTADHGLGEVLTGSARLAEEARLGHDSSNGGAR